MFNLNRYRINAVKVLAYAGNVHEFLWTRYLTDFIQIDQAQELLPKHFLTYRKLILALSEDLIDLVKNVGISAVQGNVRKSSYHGFDVRDIKDFNLTEKDYEEDERSIAQARQRVEDLNEQILMVLLLMTQMVMRSADIIVVGIENSRDHFHIHGKTPAQRAEESELSYWRKHLYRNDEEGILLRNVEWMIVS